MCHTAYVGTTLEEPLLFGLGMSSSEGEFNEALGYLHLTLQNSLQRLLIEAKRRNCIAPPYGRPPTPSPFVNENEIDLEALLNDPLECESHDRASFNYDYGFNPLIYLSDLLLRAHPRSIAARQTERKMIVERLTSRANHAKRQLSLSQELTNRAKSLQSGIVHGPLTSPLSSNSILFWCRTALAGNLIVQIAKNPHFHPLQRTVVIPSNGLDEPIKYLLDDLQPSSHYFLRCYLQGLQDSDEVEQEQEMSLNKTSTPASPSQHGEENDDSTVHPSGPPDTRTYAKGQFWTLMAEGGAGGGSTQQVHHSSSASSALEILILSRYPNYKPIDPSTLATSAPPLTTLWPEEHDLQTSPSPIEQYGYGLLSRHSPHPLFTCYVGDILTPSSTVTAASSPLWNIFNTDVLLSSTTGQYPASHNAFSPLQLGSLFMAWNDTSLASDTSLKAEEVIFKQWSYENRKYEKKVKERSEKEKTEPNKYAKRPLGPPPVLTRPPMTSSFNTIVTVSLQLPSWQSSTFSSPLHSRTSL
jgi:hypothetical protein